MSLSKKVREELGQFVFDNIRDYMFGDGQEDEMVWDGVEFKGIHNMTDEELITEALNYTGEEEDLIQQARAELAVDKVLKGEAV